MNKSKSMNRRLVARRLESAIDAGQLPDSVAAQATELLARIDQGAGGINSAVTKLLATAWSSTARAVATGAAKPAALRVVLALEASLGLTPVVANEPVTEPVAEASVEPAAEAVDDDTDAVEPVASNNAARSAS
jgi:hypothetical protein